MELDVAKEITAGFINTRAQHPMYERCVEMRRKYKALITGENCDYLLQQFARREDDDAFEQRVALTISITPAVCASLMKPFNKVLRNNKVKKSYDFGTKTRNENVEKMRTGFYGRKKSSNKGFDYWIKMRYPMLSFIDPNSWVVIEWNAAKTAAEVIQPRPYEVTSDDAWHWSVKNEETKWLWVHNCITYMRLQQSAGQTKKDAKTAQVFVEAEGDKFTLYDEECTLLYVQVDPEYMKSIGYTRGRNEYYWQDEKKNTYLVKVFTPKLGYVPAFRVGYIQDPETNGETFVNGFHDAMPYLMKSIKTVSEMDLTMCLHAFPQKMQYVQPCPGVEKKGCTSGKDKTGVTCKNCNGIGFIVHTTAQDALYFKLPTDPQKQDLLDLDKMLVYKNPPIDLLKFQNEYILQLKRDCREAVFTQTSMTKTNGPTQQGAPSTATEITNNMQGVYDALMPFTEKISDVWIDGIYTFGRLAGTPETYPAKVVCIFPADPKMKSIEELLADLKTANEAQAPAFLIDQINIDIANIMYEGDEIAMQKFTVKHSFFPFNGQSADEIAMNVSSQYCSVDTKILYTNFEAIFAELDLENPGFWFLTYDEQAVKVEEMVAAFKEEIETDNALSLTIPGAGGDAGGDPAGDNAGNDNPDEETPPAE